jgi:hypothetical protein
MSAKSVRNVLSSADGVVTATGSAGDAERDNFSEDGEKRPMSIISHLGALLKDGTFLDDEKIVK